ncbi:peptidase family M1-domain-containing protein [Naematelia encephala]|uniref:Aminopeptidase n=1 Tax=Naematelia encephala TaxID=71784 RepID=A0A1Y2BKL5_9TREE|nr:peptidase family M1-domain-containing protein [Naematelia encephala]
MAGMFLVSLAQWALGIFGIFGPSSDVRVGSDTSIRLPQNIKPLTYDLAVRTDLEAKRFWGAEAITIQANTETHKIKLHAGCNLDIDLMRVCDVDQQCWEVREHNYKRNCEARTLSIDTEDWHVFQPNDTFVLVFRWTSPISSGSDGYILSPDVGFPDTSFSAVTRFEPIEARAVFPSFDEPSPKSSWTITLIGRNETVNLANMEASSERGLYRNTEVSTLERLLVEEIDLNGSWKSTHFPSTPLMSINNVAWGNGRFNRIKSSYFSKIRNETISTAVYANLADLSGQNWTLEIMDRVTPLYESLFGVAFPLPKLYWLATPAFGGGIEHWGLITGGSDSSAWSEGQGAASKATVASFVAHEVAHQWFANLVTMSWWDDVWLNEAFATYASDGLIGPVIDEDFNTWKTYQDEHVEKSMTLDALTSHPIITPIEDEAQLSTAFDTITYDKGASVLRMIAEVVGENVFLRGVSTYLQKFAYSNAVGKDLWDQVSLHVNGLDVAEFADAWTKQAGFPVVQVAKLRSDTYRLIQARYLVKNTGISQANNQTWPIPLLMKMTPGHSAMLIMNQTSIELTLANTEQLVLNRGRRGYYRVQYDQIGFAWMREHFISRSSELSGVDRAAFLYDLTSFARSGRVPTVDVLDLQQYLTGETDVSVWNAAATFLLDLRSLFWEQPDAEQRALDQYVAGVVAETYADIGFAAQHNETARVGKIRQLILPLVGWVGIPSFVQESKKLAAALHNDTSSPHGVLDLPVTTIRVMLESAVRYGNETDWQLALTLWNKDRHGSLATAALRSLGQTQDPAIISKILEMLDDGTLVDGMIPHLYILLSLISNPTARRPTVDWALINLNKILRLADNLLRDTVLSGLFSSLSSQKDLDSLKQRFGDKPAWRGLLTVYDSIEVSVEWLARDKERIAKWLKQQAGAE